MSNNKRTPKPNKCSSLCAVQYNGKLGLLSFYVQFESAFLYRCLCNKMGRIAYFLLILPVYLPTAVSKHCADRVRFHSLEASLLARCRFSILHTFALAFVLLE